MMSYLAAVLQECGFSAKQNQRDPFSSILGIPRAVKTVPN